MFAILFNDNNANENWQPVTHSNGFTPVYKTEPLAQNMMARLQADAHQKGLVVRYKIEPLYRDNPALDNSLASPPIYLRGQEEGARQAYLNVCSALHIPVEKNNNIPFLWAEITKKVNLIKRDKELLASVTKSNEKLENQIRREKNEQSRKDMDFRLIRERLQKFYSGVFPEQKGITPLSGDAILNLVETQNNINRASIVRLENTVRDLQATLSQERKARAETVEKKNEEKKLPIIETCFVEWIGPPATIGPTKRVVISTGDKAKVRFLNADKTKASLELAEGSIYGWIPVSNLKRIEDPAYLTFDTAFSPKSNGIQQSVEVGTLKPGTVARYSLEQVPEKYRPDVPKEWFIILPPRQIEQTLKTFVDKDLTLVVTEKGDLKMLSKKQPVVVLSVKNSEQKKVLGPEKFVVSTADAETNTLQPPKFQGTLTEVDFLRQFDKKDPFVDVALGQSFIFPYPTKR